MRPWLYPTSIAWNFPILPGTRYPGTQFDSRTDMPWRQIGLGTALTRTQRCFTVSASRKLAHPFANSFSATGRPLS